MKMKLRYAIGLLLLILFNISANAQVPAISYTPSSQTFTVGTKINPWLPVTGGGTVPSPPAYANVTTLLATGTSLSAPNGAVLDGLGNIYMVNGNHTITKTDLSTGVTSIIAGIPGTPGSADNPGATATFNYPTGIAYDGSGFLYVADYLNNTIRKISTASPFTVTTIAGSGTAAETDGNGTGAAFNNPRGIIYDTVSGNLYVCDFTGGTLRQITPTGDVTTIATIPAATNLTYDGTNFYITTHNIYNSIVKVGPSPAYTVSTFAGSGAASEVDGTATGATFNSPAGITYDSLSGCLYVSDYGGNKIRKITIAGAVVTTLAGSGTVADVDGVAAKAQFATPYTINTDNAGNLYVCDSTTNAIRPINIIGYSISPNLPKGLSFNTATGVITGTPKLISSSATYTVTATNSSGSVSTTITIHVNAATPSSIYYSPSTNLYTYGIPVSTLTPTNTGCTPTGTYANVTSVSASGFSNPQGIAVDSAGNIYTANYNANTITQTVIATGVTTIIAGSGAAGSSDNATGTLATFKNPEGIVYTGGYLYVTDAGNNIIRKISTTAPYAVTTFAGTAGSASDLDGTGTAALFNNLGAITYDGYSNLYICEAWGPVKKITIPGAVVTTIATINTPATGSPNSILYGDGSLYVSTASGLILNIITYAPYTISTFAGVAGSTSSVDGTGTSAEFYNPEGMVYDQASHCIYVADENSYVIRKITLPGAAVTTVAGKAGISGTTDGIGNNATFGSVYGLADDNGGNIYVSDTGGNIRQMGITGWSISPNLPAGLSFSSSTGAISGTPTTGSTLTAYTVTATCTSGSSSTIVNIGVGGLYDWISGTAGSANTTDWNTPTNWSPAGVPGQSDVARIGVSTASFTIQPSITTNATVGSVIFGSNSGATPQPVVSIAASSSLTINSSLVVSTSTLAYINGGGSGSTIAKVNMAPGSIVTVNSGSSEGALILNTSIATPTLQFTLESDSTGDASIGPLGTNSYFISPYSTAYSPAVITVQRYLSARRGYRLLTSPIFATAPTFTYGATTSQVRLYTIHYVADSAYVQGTTGTSGGFDKAGNPTLYLFRENMVPQFNSFTNSDFRGINNINATTSPPYYSLDVDGSGWPLPVENGFLFYFVGSRAAANTNPWIPGTTTDATLSETGYANTGQITFTDWFTAGGPNLSYTASAASTAQPGTNLVGNPYAGTINWDTFQTSTTTTGIYGLHVDNTIWVLDPVTQNYGAYIAGFGGIGSANYATNIISSGQAFFVHANATGAQLIFNETAKPSVNTSIPASQTVLDVPSHETLKNILLNTQALKAVQNMSSPGYVKNARSNMPVDVDQKSFAATSPIINTTPPIQYLRMQIGQTGALAYEQTLVRFSNEASFTYDSSVDALYKSGYGPLNIATYGSNKANLAIQTIPYPGQKNDTIKLVVYAANDGAYQLTLSHLVNVPPMYDIWLKDAYKNDSLDIKHVLTYNFNIYKADTNSYGNKRFSLIVRQNPANAYRLLNFNAHQVISNNQVLIKWQTANEGTGMNFIVQRSTDNGTTFSDIGTLQSNGAGNYSFSDDSPVNGLNMYRLQQVDVNNASTYSDIVSVRFFGSPQKVSDVMVVYPNPGKGLLNIIINPPASHASYTIKFINSQGIVQKEFTTTLPTWNGDISNLEMGFYIIQVSGGSSSNIIGSSKFIKQ